MTVSLGARLGPYEVLELLGAGGMGEVYRARDTRLGRDVALKVLPPEIASDADRLRRFEQEARAVAALNHPHILTLHDVGTHEGTPYVVTELLEGENLREVLSRRNPTARQVLGWGVQTAQGLAAAHQKGIVHRDLKPENLFLTTDGRVKILDFGLAKLAGRAALDTEAVTEAGPTRPGLLMGTVPYMSPEQVQARPVDSRSDIFSFGVVLYELLTRRHPFRRETAAATLSAILQDTPAELGSLDPAIPRALDGIVRRCLEKQREQRFQGAHDLALALEAVLAAPTGAAFLQEVEERPPYPGLQSFTEKDASVFFGREAEGKALWERIRSRQLLAVIGPSGAGKTSFLRAGVIPARPEGWAALVCTPGTAPFRGLGQALGPALAGDAEALGQLAGFEDPETALALVSRWRRSHAEALLVVDQFEELFTLSPPETQQRFAALLGRLASDADAHVVLSLRDDFLIRCSDQPPLAPVFREITPLTALTRDGLERALVEPARKQGYRFDDDTLVSEMVSLVEGVRGALPLLAFAMARLWEKRDRGKKTLTREAYREIAGVEGALAQHAEATMDRIGPERQTTVREIFRNLVTAQRTRAVIERHELLSAFPERTGAEEVLAQLIDARLLTTYEVEGKEGEPTHHRVEVVHESLLTAWPRLVRWQAQDEEGALLRDQLKQAAHLWDEKGRSADLLWTGTAYQEYELWRGRYPGALTALEEDFARSMADRARRRRRLRRLVAGSVIAAAVAVAAVTGALWRRSEAARERAAAEARRAEAGALIALGRAELDRYPSAAVAYARRSLEVADTPEGRRFVVDALWRSPTVRILPLGSEVVWSADFSPDDHWLAAFAFSGRLLLFPEDGRPPRIVQGQPQTAFPPVIRFTRDGEALLAQTPEEASVGMYSVPDGREIRRFEPKPATGRGAGGQPSPRTGAPSLLKWSALPHGLLAWWQPFWRQKRNWRAFPAGRVPFGVWPYDGGPPTRVGSWPAGRYVEADPEGSWLLTWRGRPLSLRPIAGGDDAAERPVGTLEDANPKKPNLGFTANGHLVYFADVADGMGRLRLWSLGRDVAADARAFFMPSPDGAFEPTGDGSGSRVAWGSSAEKAVWLWDLAGPPDAAPTVLRRPDTSATKQGLFAPSRDWLVVAHGSSLAFWTLARPRARVLAGHAGNVSRLTFTPDSQGLLSCGADDVRLWPLGPGRGRVRRVAADYRGECADAALAPDGDRLVLVGTWGVWLAESFDGRGRWLTGGGDDFSSYIGAAAWGAARKLIGAASWYATTEPQSIFLFDTETGRERRLPLTPPGETGQGYDWGVSRLAFTPEGRLLAGGSGGVRWFDPDTGASDWIWRLPKEMSTYIAISADGRRAAATAVQGGGKAAPAHGIVLVDLESGALQPVRSHGGAVIAVGLDATGRTLVTGDTEGVVRVGSTDGGEPHRLCCHAGVVRTISVSPDGQWIASASGGEIRLWPMPDVSKPPLHTQPYEELIAKLHTLTNLQVVEDKASPTGYKLEVGPFPGWKDVPTW